MSPTTAEARRRIVLMLLREGRIGPGVAEAGAVSAPTAAPAAGNEPARGGAA